MVAVLIPSSILAAGAWLWQPTAYLYLSVSPGFQTKTWQLFYSSWSASLTIFIHLPVLLFSSTWTVYLSKFTVPVDSYLPCQNLSTLALVLTFLLSSLQIPISRLFIMASTHSIVGLEGGYWKMNFLVIRKAQRDLADAWALHWKSWRHPWGTKFVIVSAGFPRRQDWFHWQLFIVKLLFPNQ